jgi:hypothetical protein
MTDGRGASLRIEDPNVGDAHPEVLLNTGEHLAQGVLGREHLDAQQGRRSDDLLIRAGECGDGDVRNAKTTRLRLHPRIEIHANTPLFAAAVGVVREKELQSPVIGFAHVALLHRAVDVIDVWPEWGAQVSLDGHSKRMGGGCHGVSLLDSRRPMSRGGSC